MKTPPAKVVKKVNTDPILFDGKTFDDEISARANDPKEETIEDVIRHLKETFNTPPKGNIQDHLDDSERAVLSERAFEVEKQVYHPSSDKEHIKNMHKAFVDVVKNGVDYDKLNTLDNIIKTSNDVHGDDKFAVGRMWSRTIRNAFGIGTDELSKIPFEDNALSKADLIRRTSMHRDLKFNSLQHGYTEHEHLSIPIAIHPHENVAHVVNSDAMFGGGFDHFTPYDKEFDENEKHREDLHQHYKNHFTSILDKEPSAIRPLVDYTGAASGRLNRFLIHSHTGNEEGVNTELRNNDHIYPDKEAFHQHIDDVSRLIKESPPLKKPMVVYSGLSGRSGIIHHAEKHKQTSTEPMKFHLPAFTSTSVKFSIGSAFAKDAPILPDEETIYHPKSYRKDIQDVLRIHLPEGHNDGTYVEPITENTGEYEYLLDKGHTLKVHPEPKYTLRGRSVYRIWEAHPHKEEE